MSNRTKRNLRRLQMNLKKDVFNSRYIVRNTLAVTVMFTVVAMIFGIATVAGDRIRTAAKADLVAAVEAGKSVQEETQIPEERVLTVNAVDTLHMNQKSINMLMAAYDDAETVVEANESQMVAETNRSYGDVFAVATGNVNIRLEAVMSSKVIASLEEGTVGEIVDQNGPWIRVRTEDTEGYVKALYVLTGSRAEAYAKEHEATLEIVASSSTDKDTEDSSTDGKTTEDPKDSSDDSEDSGDSGESGVITGYSNRSDITLSAYELNLMASIVMLEAGGESFDGQVAVANVILNRVQNGYWGKTVTDVIYAPGQFSTARSSALSQYLTNGAPDYCVQAVQTALNGTNNVAGFMYFKPVSLTDVSQYSNYMIIGNHFFY